VKSKGSSAIIVASIDSAATAAIAHKCIHSQLEKQLLCSQPRAVYWPSDAVTIEQAVASCTIFSLLLHKTRDLMTECVIAMSCIFHAWSNVPFENMFSTLNERWENA